ncbi:MAG: DUF4421 family protein [Winogradskyella sp.]|uniref:DUF4421 family protein n=1 Tax=Winogradskyella sp. TaxID=1883156 RepID=UPI00385B077B
MLKQDNFKKTLIQRLWLILVACFCCIVLNAQDLNDLDSLLIDRNIENYSIRIFANYKDNRFRVQNENARVRFVPNNRNGLGVGFANEKMIVDVAFNIRGRNKEETTRFDLQGMTIVNERHFVNVYAQTYKGFRSKNNVDAPTIFINDLRSVSLGFNYLRTLDDIAFSYALLKAGLDKDEHKRVFITAGLGAFGSFDYFSTQPGILSETTAAFFNERANIRRYQAVSIGVLAGVVSYFKLPENITATINVMPGLGLMNKKITLPNATYRPSNPLLYKLDFHAGLNYSLNQYYVSLTYSNGLYATDFDFGNKYRLNLTNAKLAIGYRFKTKKKR